MCVPIPKPPLRIFPKRRLFSCLCRLFAKKATLLMALVVYCKQIGSRGDGGIAVFQEVSL